MLFSLEIHECNSHPCLNNGTCADIHTGLEDLIGSGADQDYACICEPGFTDKNCQTGNLFIFSTLFSLFSTLFFFFYPMPFSMTFSCIQTTPIVPVGVLYKIQAVRYCCGFSS